MTTDLLDEASVCSYRAAMHKAVDTLADHLGTVKKPYAGRSPQTLDAEVDSIDLDRPLNSTGAALTEIRDLYLENAVWFHSRGYAAHLNCPVLVPALAAEVLVSGVNSSLDTWDQSSVATLIERRLVRWTAERIGFGASADGLFTSGGTQSNLQGLLLARESALEKNDVPNCSRVENLARMRVLASDQAHFSVATSAHTLGLSPEAVIAVPSDREGRMRPDALTAELDAVRRRGDVVMAIVATAGTTDLGAIDPLKRCAEAANTAGTWLHVDAAYGCGLLNSRRRFLLDGIERADSVTIDFHKSFFQPISSSVLVVQNASTLRRIAHHADYLNPRQHSVPNQVDKSLQTTRRFDALKLWMSLRTLGAHELGRLFDEVIDLAHKVWEEFATDPELRFFDQPQMSTILLRYAPDGLDEQIVERLVAEVHADLFADGRALVAKTRIRGQAWLKLTLLNPNSQTTDVAMILEHVRAAGRARLGQQDSSCANSVPASSTGEFAGAAL